LRVLGFRQVRVRHHGETARIEIERADFRRLLDDGAAEAITEAFKKLGFTYVCLDLAGYRTGSMNEGLMERADRAGVNFVKNGNTVASVQKGESK
jgi:uncharacterized protein